MYSQRGVSFTQKNKKHEDKIVECVVEINASDNAQHKERKNYWSQFRFLIRHSKKWQFLIFVVFERLIMVGGEKKGKSLHWRVAKPHRVS